MCTHAKTEKLFFSNEKKIQFRRSQIGFEK